jgi:hypothetical protein
MPRVRYACCKHGPCCGFARCGFAHCLGDIRVPTSLYGNARVWRDQTRISGGHAGIDFFLGQEYSPLQWERLAMYLAAEPVASLPLWAKRLAWFMDVGNPEDYVYDGDLGWSEDALLYFDIAVAYDGGLHRHRFPFVTAVDRRGMTLEERMYERMTTGTYTLWAAETDTSESCSSKIAPYTFREAGKKYLQVDKGDLYVLVVQGRGVMQAYWWLSRYDDADSKECEVCGWAKKCHFAFVAEEVSTWVRSVPPVSDFGPN